MGAHTCTRFTPKAHRFADHAYRRPEPEPPTVRLWARTERERDQRPTGRDRKDVGCAELEMRDQLPHGLRNGTAVWTVITLGILVLAGFAVFEPAHTASDDTAPSSGVVLADTPKSEFGIHDVTRDVDAGWESCRKTRKHHAQAQTSETVRSVAQGGGN